MLWYLLSFKFCHEKLQLFLLFVRFVVERFLQTLIDLFDFLLSFHLISPNIMLLFKILPDLELVDEIREDIVDVLQSR